MAQLFQMEQFQDIRARIDSRACARIEYETRVASKNDVLDVGGRNQQSRSNRRLRQLSTNPDTRIVSTDIIADYEPDLVDDICDSRIGSDSYDGVYCYAILEHVTDYGAALNHIHRILKPGGELFVYVPFVYRFHDRMDYHRFTYAEVDRMLGIFKEHTIFLPDGNGYGGVQWLMLTFCLINRLPRLWGALASCANALLSIPLTLAYWLNLYGVRSTCEKQGISFREFKLYCTHFAVNHGFCGYAVK